MTRFLLLCICLCLVIPASVSAKKIKVRLGTVAPEGTPWAEQAKTTRKHLRKHSGGKIKLKAYLGGRKGDEPVIMQKVISGDLEMAGVSNGAYARFVPELSTLVLPFLFDSNAEIDFILDKYLYEPVRQVSRGYGIEFYQWAENGWLNIGLQGGFVKTPGDLGGKPIRSQKTLISQLTSKAFGGTPVPLESGEVMDAFKANKIVGFLQTPLFTFAASWHTKITHYTVTGHRYDPAMMFYSSKWFDTMTPEIQKILLSDAQADTEASRKAVRQLAPELMKNFESYGIKVYTLSASERKAFKKASINVRKEFEKTANAGSLKLLKAIDKGKKAFKK